jgi:hypothetical protein
MDVNDAPSPELSADSPNEATEALPKSPTTKPTRMLEIIAFASLDVVGTENFLRYGPTGPLRYVKGIPEGHNSPQNSTPSTTTLHFGAPIMSRVKKQFGPVMIVPSVPK